MRDCDVADGIVQEAEASLSPSQHVLEEIGRILLQLFSIVANAVDQEKLGRCATRPVKLFGDFPARDRIFAK